MNDMVSLEQFIAKYDSSREKDIPELNKMFLSMDKNMKMYHENNYVITSFRVQDIIIERTIDKNSEFQYNVQFTKYDKLDNTDVSISENILYSTCLAIGIYNNCLSYIDPNNIGFLKSNFHLFAENMPSDVVPYYRGVIERGASVYLTDYVDAKEKQEIERMREEARREEDEERKRNEIKKEPPLSSKDNATWGTSDAAFSLVALFPLVIAFLGVLIPLIFSLMS